MSARVALLVCLCATGCLQSLSLDALGFRCHQDTDCDDATRCVDGFCATVGVPPGTMLTPLQGDQNLSQDGQVLDAKDITGCVTVSASNVTIRRSRITCNGYYAITAYATTMGTRVEDVELRGTNSGAFVGIEVANGTLARLDIHGFDRGADLGTDVVLESSYVHDLNPDRAGAVECTGGSDVHLRNNRIDRGTSADVGSAIRFISDTGPLDDVWLESNRVNGGPYTLEVIQRAGGAITGLHVLNNRFGRNFVDGPLHLDAISASVDVSGNVFDDNGEPVP